MNVLHVTGLWVCMFCLKRPFSLTVQLSTSIYKDTHSRFLKIFLKLVQVIVKTPNNLFFNCILFKYKSGIYYHAENLSSTKMYKVKSRLLSLHTHPSLLFSSHSYFRGNHCLWHSLLDFFSIHSTHIYNCMYIFLRI